MVTKNPLYREAQGVFFCLTLLLVHVEQQIRCLTAGPLTGASGQGVLDPGEYLHGLAVHLLE